MLYVHPALGLVTLMLLVWLAIAGFRSRHAAPYAAASRRLHRRLGTGVAVLFLVTAVLGVASVVWLRDDLSPATTLHGIAASAGVVLLCTLYLLGRQVPRVAWVRRWHPWVGLGTLLVAGAIFVFGLGLLP